MEKEDRDAYFIATISNLEARCIHLQTYPHLTTSDDSGNAMQLYSLCKGIRAEVSHGKKGWVYLPHLKELQTNIHDTVATIMCANLARALMMLQ
jgi:hypothetical protein